MRKSTIFISAVLTTFALVMLYGVVSAYRNISNITSDINKVSAPTENIVTPTSTNEATATRVIITPEQAAQLAVQVTGNSNLLSAESSNINGVNAYKITFTNNDVVYVGLDGQILGVQIAPVVNIVQLPVKQKDKSDNNTHISSGGGESHEADDHEEHDDD